MKKGKLRILATGIVAFYCKGCGQYHGLNIDKDYPVNWDFNGDYDKPTFSPSIMARTGHYIPEHKGSCWCNYYEEHPEETPAFKCSICHSYVRDGKIEYLSDCTHDLAGQTIDLE